jgi:hypothetical protein
MMTVKELISLLKKKDPNAKFQWVDSTSNEVVFLGDNGHIAIKLNSKPEGCGFTCGCDGGE